MLVLGSPGPAGDIVSVRSGSSGFGSSVQSFIETTVGPAREKRAKAESSLGPHEPLAELSVEESARMGTGPVSGGGGSTAGNHRTNVEPLPSSETSCTRP
ncbi:unannotated protein [freshwater metagenome]|uniref:Unannotated protein n=1 Tax=freshwater metagenome TaxID=449393 RepID=A0A6J6U8A7_9ZZZZ